MPKLEILRPISFFPSLKVNKTIKSDFFIYGLGAEKCSFSYLESMSLILIDLPDSAKTKNRPYLG